MNLIPPQGFGPTHGTLTIFTAPRAVLKHIEWGISEALGFPISLQWEVQPLVSGTFQSSLNWRGGMGAGSRIATHLRGWHYLRFELFEPPSHGSDGSLFLFDPELGLYRGDVGPHGDIIVNENQINQILRDHIKESDITEKLERIIGRPWDVSFEPFRRGLHESSDVTLGRLSV